MTLSTISPADAKRLIDQGAVLIDMNGNVLRSWKHIVGFPVTILPGGYVMGGTVGRATASTERTPVRSVAATYRSTSSPAAWP